jgi:hypothetical protein
MKCVALGGLKWLKIVIYTLAAVAVFELLVWRVLTLAASDNGDVPAWSAPSAMAIRRVSPVTGAQSEPNLFSNLDCMLTTYRRPASSTMQTGCFTETAFGLFDSDNSVVILNGSDEGLPLLPYSPSDILAPWPRAANMLSLNAVNTGGSTIRLYKNPVGQAQDRRNLLLQLTAKKIAGPPDLTLKDKEGQNLVINSQTLAFSDGGAWLVAETVNGSFVRINLATLEIKAFAASFGSQGSPALLQSRVAINENGRYVAIFNNAAQSFKVYDLVACTGSPANLQPENCPAFDYLPFIKNHVSKLLSIRHVRFVNDGLISFDATSSDTSSGGIYELAPTASIDSLIDYLGLGDSFTSGEGAFDYLAGTDSEDNSCHLSARSYPLLLTHDLFTTRGGHSVACSGAVIHDVGSRAKDYRGQVAGVPDYEHLQNENEALLNSVMANFIPGYVAQQRFVAAYQPAVTTVSVGGNDVGFGDILTECVIPHVSRHTSDNVCFNTYEDRQELIGLIDRTGPRWTRLFNQLRAEAPASRLYAIGYPSIVSDTGSCGLNVNLNKSELEFAEELVAYINAAIKKSAANAGIFYVDISKALVGRRLCEATSANIAVNGLTAGRDAGLFGIKVFGKESYHPNILGQWLIEQAVLRQTHNLTAALPDSGSSSDGGQLAEAPKTGRKIVKRSPARLTMTVLKRGGTARVYLKGAQVSLKPRTDYKVHLDGPSGPAIGAGTTDDNGDLDVTVPVPVDTPPGGHTIDVTGDDQTDEPINVTQPVYMPVSDTDADGDSINDGNDSCPAAINSGVDADQDGIDDICDGYIGLPASGPPAGPPIGSGNGSTPTPGSGTTDSPADDPPLTSGNVEQPGVTAVAHFDTSRPMAATIGQTTVDPFKTPAKTLYTPDKVDTAVNSYRAGAKLSLNINWWPWLVLAVFVWLLLAIIGLWLDEIMQRRQPQGVYT